MEDYDAHRMAHAAHRATIEAINCKPRGQSEAIFALSQKALNLTEKANGNDSLAESLRKRTRTGSRNAFLAYTSLMMDNFFAAREFHKKAADAHKRIFQAPAQVLA